jgi:flagellar protein FliS
MADPHKLVRLLFDALLVAIGSSKLAIQRKDVAAKVKHISHAIRILEEGLIAPLDMEKGGEIAANLKNLYDYCVMRLIRANVGSDEAMLDEVRSLLEPVIDGWAQINGRGPAYLKPL